MGRLLIEEDLLVKYGIVDKDSVDGRKIHEFLNARAKKLVGDIIDLDKEPVTFLMSSSSEPNAFFMPQTGKANGDGRSQDYDIRKVVNPYDTPVICVTKGLIDFVDNLDQLDFVLGHELTHMILGAYGSDDNSKGEEEVSDLHSVDMVYDAGGDPKQALVFNEKLMGHKEELKKNNKLNQERRREKKEGIKWSEILDVHMMDGNRTSAIEASLTRLSHLIDNRVPTALDKSLFAVEYHDQLIDFINEQQYDTKSPAEKLKILVDAADHLSFSDSMENYIAKQLQMMPSKNEFGYNYEVEYKIEYLHNSLKKNKDGGTYFTGMMVEKRLQQKIAVMTEEIISELEKEREQEAQKIFGKEYYMHSRFRPLLPVREALKLDKYVMDKAYAHIKKSGYPKASDINYRDTSGVMYSYFSSQFSSLASDRDIDNDAKVSRAEYLPQLDKDISETKKHIRTSFEFKPLASAAREFRKLTNLANNIISAHYGENDDKFDNLSFECGFFSRSGMDKDQRYGRLRNIWGELKKGGAVPWNNLLEVANKGDEEKNFALRFLMENGIEDHRLISGHPYIRIRGYHISSVDENGKVNDIKVPGWRFDYDVNRENVMQIYDYARKYFTSEVELCEQARKEVSNICDADVSKNMFAKDDRAFSKLWNFVALYNSLNGETKMSNRKYNYSGALSLIADRYFDDNPMPKLNGERLMIDEQLLSFTNPIFIEHFGENFKEQQLSTKKKQKKRMFNAAFDVIKIAEDMWADSCAILDKEEARRSELWRKEREAKTKEEAAKYDRAGDISYKSGEFQRARKNFAETALYNLVYSVFKNESYYPQNLHCLTDGQKKKLSDYTALDSKGSFRTCFHSEGYMDLCDFSGILPEQLNRVLVGDYELTPKMAVIAKNIGHRPFGQKADDEAGHWRRRRGEFRYDNYLKIFEAMQRLENDSKIDMRELAEQVSSIKCRLSGNDDDEKAREEKRYEIYETLIRKSKFLPMFAKAAIDRSNYADLNFDDAIATVDALANARMDMAKVVGSVAKGKSPDEEMDLVIEKDYAKYFEDIDKGISFLIRDTYRRNIINKNALDKIRNLYNLYDIERDYGDTKNRKYYLGCIGDIDAVRKDLSKKSEKDDFWPENALEHVKAYAFAKNTFLDNIEAEDVILNKVLDKVRKSPAGVEKDECISILLDKNFRASFPETRQKLFDIYADDALENIGRDDGTNEYREKLKKYLKVVDERGRRDWDSGNKRILSGKVAEADRYTMLRKLADKLVTQEQTSEDVKKAGFVQISPNDLASSQLQGIGIDFLSSMLDDSPEQARKFITFFNSRGENKECSDMSEHMKNYLRSQGKFFENLDTKKIDAKHCKALYENFWSAPLEARAVLIARMLKSATKGNEEECRREEKRSWEDVFDIVMDNMIKPEDKSVESRYAREIMHSYIKARSNYERELILSAMMVANRNIGSDAGNVGKALRLFLENMGPAEIKLGQAVSSHPDTPEKIRSELQNLKGEAAMPARWEIFEWIKREKIPEGYWKNKHMGETLGSASYYTSIALGDDKVLRILRPEAREKAEKGFRVLPDTVADLKIKDEKSELDYKNLTESVSEMVAQADRMSAIETDHKLGEEQYRNAQKLYNGVKVECDSYQFSFKVMDWRAKGENWIVMDRAQGYTFNALPAVTNEQKKYKRAFAKAYIALELRNILSGKKFDHDRHGAQLCIKPETNEVGIFDTGAMALKSTTIEEQRMLGDVVYKMVVSNNRQEPLSAVGGILSKKIEELHEQNNDTRYLVEVQKGILALGDFFKVLSPSDVVEILAISDIPSVMSLPMKAVIMERISGDKKAQEAFAIFNKMSSPIGAIKIRKSFSLSSSYVANEKAMPDKDDKSAWLSEVFLNSGKKKANGTSRQRDIARALKKIVVA